MKLYYAAGTRATRARWMLEELGVPYGLVRVNLASPMFGVRVPTFVDGDVTLTGSAAICAYLGDRFGAGRLAPPPGAPERALYVQWLHYAAAALDPPLLDAALAVEREDHEAATSARNSFAQRSNVLEIALHGTPFLFGSEFTTVDVVVGSIVKGAADLGLVREGSHLHDYLARLSAREAYWRARAD